MTNFRRVLITSLLFLAACAKQNFGQNYRITPTLTPARTNVSEFERRELDRLQEVNLLQAERDELTDVLRESHRVFLGEVGILDAQAVWKETPARERAEIAVALGRVVSLSRRSNFLTGRETADDPVLMRAIEKLRSLRKFRATVEPYYGH